MEYILIARYGDGIVDIATDVDNNISVTGPEADRIWREFIALVERFRPPWETRD